VSTPISRSNRKGCIAHDLVFLVGERLGRGHGDRVARVYPMGSKFSMEQTMNAVVRMVADHSISYSFQPRADSSIRSSWVGRGRVRAGRSLELLWL